MCGLCRDGHVYRIGMYVFQFSSLSNIYLYNNFLRGNALATAISIIYTSISGEYTKIVPAGVSYVRMYTYLHILISASTVDV